MTNRRARAYPLAAWVAGAIILPAVVIAGALLLRSDAKPEPGDAPPVVVITPPAASAPPVGALLHAQDVHLSLKTVGRQCFGTAGCNVSVEVVVGWEAPYGVTPADSWRVIYQIGGDESGPIVGSVSVMGDGTYEVNVETMHTRGSAVKPTIAVVEVEKI